MSNIKNENKSFFHNNNPSIKCLKIRYKKQESNLNLFNFRFFEVTHIRTNLLKHERSITSIRFWKSNLIWRYIRIVPGLSGGFGNIWRIIHFDNFLLPSYIFFFLIPLLVSDHFQILDLGLRSGRQSFFHTLLSLFIISLKILSFALVLNDIGLAHWQLRYGSFHFSCQISKSALELVDLLWNL